MNLNKNINYNVNKRAWYITTIVDVSLIVSICIRTMNVNLNVNDRPLS